MIQRYLVSSAGRSGCHLVAALIRSCNKISNHTHDPFCTPAWLGDPEGKNTAIVLLERKDLFSAIMSMLITRRTNQFSQYPVRQIEPFSIDCKGPECEFAHQYGWHKNYIKSCTTLGLFAEVKHMFFEDVIADYNHVYSQLAITPSVAPRLPDKAPYSYHDIVLNVDECKKKFDFLESTYVFVPILKPFDPNPPK